MIGRTIGTEAICGGGAVPGAAPASARAPGRAGDMRPEREAAARADRRGAAAAAER